MSVPMSPSCPARETRAKGDPSHCAVPIPRPDLACIRFRPTIASPLFSASLGGRAAAREASAGALSPFHARALGARSPLYPRVGWGSNFQCCRTPPFLFFFASGPIQPDPSA